MARDSARDASRRWKHSAASASEAVRPKPTNSRLPSGVGHWVRPQPVDGGPLFEPAEQGPPIRGLQAMLALYGYGLELTGAYDKPTQTVVAAFQRHFRPERVDGMADRSTIETLKALIDGL